MPTPTVINKFRYSDVINRRYWDNKYFFEPMSVNPAVSKVGGGAAAGAGAEVDVIITNKNAFEMFNIVGNTNIGPKLDGAFGWNLAPDATNTHAVEYDTGITPQNPFTFLIDQTGNTTPAFFLKAVFQSSGVLGCNILIGFRAISARNATLANYTDFAVLNSLAGIINTQTQIATGGVVTTNTTNFTVNATTFEMKVNVDAFGKVTYEFNGAPPIVLPATQYQFANGLTVMPFMRITQNAVSTTTASGNWFECGFQS